MYHKLLIKPSFHALLVIIDDELAEQTRKEACYACGGVLHQANYPRSSLGLPLDCRDYYEQRRSYCRGQCRKRPTTQSVRFFGRSRFPAPTLVLLSCLKRGVTTRSLIQVRRFLGVIVSKRTWKRWYRWWRECFITTTFWKQAKALVPPICLNGSYPRTLLLMAYQGTFNKRLVAVLRFLAPLTAGIYRAV